jgi:outer membrane lipoprotein SlyB
MAMTPYERGFLTKCAQAGLSEQDTAALKAFIAEQQENKKRREAQNKALRAQNRSERRFSGMLGGGVLGGLGGAALGALAGGRLGFVAGGIGGALGGGYLGKRLGNRLADKMEKTEDTTGVSIQDQLAAIRQRQMMWQLAENRMHQSQLAHKPNATY